MQSSHRLSVLLRHSALLAVTALSLVVLDGCASRHKPHPMAMEHHQAIFSPNGELLSGGPLGHPSCQVAYGQWFDRLDAAKTGAITHDVFMADADTQFKTMDIDHDGYITAAELTKYRAAYDFDPSLGFSVEHEGPTFGDDKAKKEHDNNAPDWARSKWTPDSSDPVMSADRSLKFKVSRADFMAQAEEIFGKLAGKPNGVIPKNELLAVCPSDKPEESSSWF